MSIEWMDNFQNYGTDETNLLDGVYADYNDAILSADPDGVSTGRVIKISSADSAAGYLRRVFSSNLTTVGIGARYWFTTLPTSSTYLPSFVMFNDVANATNVSLSLGTTGIISAYRGNASTGTLLGSTTVPVVTAGAWYHIEAKVLASQTVGTVEVRVNETTVLTLTGQDTVSGSNVHFSQAVFASDLNADGSGVCTPFYIKDLIAWNDSGSLNNDFMGDVNIVSLYPDTDVSLNWTPSTGTDGSNLIDESITDDTDYISADATPPAAFECTLTDVDDEVVLVKGTQIVVRALKTDAGAANLQAALVSNGDVGNGADRAVTVAATYWSDVLELDPDTGTAWSPTSLNAANLRLNRTA